MICAGPVAAWDARVDGPDVFGATKVFSLEANGKASLAVQCDSEGEIFLAYISPKKPFEEVPTVPGTLLVQIDGADPVKLAAELRSWNDNYIGVVASGRDVVTVQMIEALGAAKKKINIGYDVQGMRDTDAFGTRGSSASMKKVVDHCKLSQTEG